MEAAQQAIRINELNPLAGDKESIIAQAFNSGFTKAHDTYNAISTASDGNIYYVLSSDKIDVGGKVYCYHTASGEIEYLGDLTEICGEGQMNAISQGKSHVRFYEMNGKLFFSTHVGYYELIDGMERMPVTAREGFRLYLGGHIVSFDLKTRTFEDLAIAPYGEGFVSMNMDVKRGQIYGISWPRGYFLHYDVDRRVLKNLGKTSCEGEAGMPGTDFRSLCRSLFVDPRDGTCYFSTADGNIYAYNPVAGNIGLVNDVDLKLDYFGKYDYSRPGSMGYNWRKIFWYEKDQVAYGVHGNSGYLFRFDPDKKKVEIVERITSLPSKASGMFDQFSYGYLGFQLGPDKETIYYLTGGPIYTDGKRVKETDEIAKGAARGLENLHLITYHIPSAKYQDHGPIFYGDGQRPVYVNSIAVGYDGYIYTLARVTAEDDNTRTDLIRFKNPIL
ncbi:hypothetical protein [Mucilaginibacter boryungensis]|uniref:Lipoprotein n=1 Tax=Mucilaginibacter boryungensis TaxID=768480 RepID=A0ABR9XEJ5_9SPHI|nr:hypothetical protein [Mucilaginibacter boryungensis]MBE9665500.1 hypothetical protein [Mucilaginibacter boryungensis]